MFSKLTLLTLILRLFSPIRWARWLIWAGIGSTTIVYTALSIFILGNCVPRKGQTWQYTTYYGTCTMAQERTSLVNGIFGLISDLYILVIPLWLVSHLSLPPKRKLGVMGVFLSGLLLVLALGPEVSDTFHADSPPGLAAAPPGAWLRVSLRI